MLAFIGGTDFILLGLIVIPLGLAIYMLPTIIGRKKKNIAAIALINILLGWTLIGWIVALVWGLTKDSDPVGSIPVTGYTYACKKCGFQKSFTQTLKMYKCPQCSEENMI